MGMDTGGKKGLKSEINVTPLVDVVLVLLIIFMVITPLAQRGYDLEVPKESQNVVIPPEELDKQVILSVAEQDCPIANPLQNNQLPQVCKVRINKDLTPVTELAKKMDEIFKGRKRADKILFLAAQEKLNYEGIVQILDAAKAGAGEDLKIAIVKDDTIASQAAAAGGAQ